MTDLTLAQARAILDGAIAEARRLGLRPLTIVVVDRAGHVVATAREDAASMFRFDVALGKAWAAAAMGVSSRKLGENAKGNPNFFVSLAATAHGKFLPQTGAVVIARGGEPLGAVGASGATGDEDEAACIAGVLAAGLELGPS